MVPFLIDSCQLFKDTSSQLSTLQLSVFLQSTVCDYLMCNTEIWSLTILFCILMNKNITLFLNM